MDRTPLGSLGGELATISPNQRKDREGVLGTLEPDAEDHKGADGRRWAEDGSTETRTTTG